MWGRSDRNIKQRNQTGFISPVNYQGRSRVEYSLDMRDTVLCGYKTMMAPHWQVSSGETGGHTTERWNFLQTKDDKVLVGHHQ